MLTVSGNGLGIDGDSGQSETGFTAAPPGLSSGIA